MSADNRDAARSFEKKPILKQVMLQGVDEGICCLPVHDGIAVPSDHLDWAQKAFGGR